MELVLLDSRNESSVMLYKPGEEKEARENGFCSEKIFLDCVGLVYKRISQDMPLTEVKHCTDSGWSNMHIDGYPV